MGLTISPTTGHRTHSPPSHLHGAVVDPDLTRTQDRNRVTVDPSTGHPQNELRYVRRSSAPAPAEAFPPRTRREQTANRPRTHPFTVVRAHPAASISTSVRPQH